MAIRKLHGAVDNSATLRVMASLFEHQIEFQFIDVDLKSAGHPSSFLSLSPFGDIPVLEDGDLVLFESRAAMRYISHEYSTQAIEQVYLTPLVQGVATTWIDVETHHFYPVASRLIAQLTDKPQSVQEAPNPSVAEYEEKLGRVLDVYEKRLATSDFLGGDKFTAADLTHTPYLHMLMSTRVKTVFESRPCVAAWCVKLLSRPAWVKVIDFLAQHHRV